MLIFAMLWIMCAILTACAVAIAYAIVKFKPRELAVRHYAEVVGDYHWVRDHCRYFDFT
jgi:hypothetical protein